MRHYCFHIIYFLCIFMGTVYSSDMFSSIAELEGLYVHEQKLVNVLERFVNRTGNLIASIEKYLVEVRNDQQGQMEKNKVIQNPINAFHLMKRTTVLWNDVKVLLVAELNSTENATHILKLAEYFPSFDDFSGAVYGLADLQVAYQFDMSQFARGEVQLDSHSRFVSAKGLTARDCLFIGKHAFNKGIYNGAVEWFKTATDMVRSGNDTSAPLSEIQPFMKTAIRIHDQVLEKKGPFGKDWRTNEEPYDSERLQIFRNSRKKRKRAIRKANATNSDEGVPEWEERETYFKLCRGEKLNSPNKSRNLRCRYINHLDPLFLLRPLKLEEHSLAPYVAVYHDFMSDNETAIFKSLAVERLERSEHGGRHGSTKSHYRTSKQRWIHDKAHPVVDRITKRISAAVGLNSEPANVGSEDYQVANYGIGGRYTPHTDHGTLFMNVGMNSAEQYRGDRLLTFMTYLENVDAGGATVFTRAKVTVWPKKGMAVFWWNLFSDLMGDSSTHHGGCPVLHGSKWICNKWFHSGEQMLRRPCDTTPKSRILFPRNKLEN